MFHRCITLWKTSPNHQDYISTVTEAQIDIKDTNEYNRLKVFSNFWAHSACQVKHPEDMWMFFHRKVFIILLSKQKIIAKKKIHSWSIYKLLSVFKRLNSTLLK